MFFFFFFPMVSWHLDPQFSPALRRVGSDGNRIGGWPWMAEVCGRWSSTTIWRIWMLTVDWCWLMLTDVDWCWLMLTDVDWCWLAAPWVWTASESLTSRSSSHCLFGIFRHIWLRWLAFGAKTARFNRFDQVKPFKTGGVISSPWAFSPGWYLPDSRAQAGQQWYATRSPFPVLAWLGMGNPLFMCNIYRYGGFPK